MTAREITAMGKLGNGIAAGVAVIACGVVAFGLAARSGALSPTEAELRTKYMLPSSKIMEIDGETIHYTDEGQGEPVVLVHGTFGNLRMWSDWVSALSGHYRVIRFDRPPYGLSGPDPKGRYGAAREAEIISGLTTMLGLEKFYLAATSSGGASVTQYAAQHPEQIKGLVLSNIAVQPMPADPTRNPWIVRQSRKVAAVLNGWHPEWEWREVLKVNMVNHSKITDALVTEYTELNNRPASYHAAQQPRPAGVLGARTPSDLGKITAPTLVLWSENDSERPPTPVAEDAIKFLGSQDKSLVVVPRCEHMMPLDCGPESAAAALAFLDRVSAAP